MYKAAKIHITGLTLIAVFFLHISSHSKQFKPQVEDDINLNLGLKMAEHYFHANSVETEKQKLTEWIDESFTRPIVPTMALSVVHNDAVIYSKTIRCSTKQLYSIASFTKIFISIAILQLAAKGKISLDDEINKYLPLYMEDPKLKSSQITIRHLLTHTAGITDYGRMRKVESDLVILAPEQLYPAGSRFTYSNHGYIILGNLVSVISGVKLSDYITNNILMPLEMEETIVPDNVIGSGGILANVDDLSNYIVMMLNKGRFKDRVIIPESMYNELFMESVEMPDVTVKEYRGICWRVWSIDNKPFSVNHAALWGGTAGWMQIFPTLGVGYVFLSDPDNHCESNYTAYYRSLKARLLQLTNVINPSGPDPSKFQPTLPSGDYLDNYAGRYKHVTGGNVIDIINDNGELIVKKPDSFERKRLFPTSMNSFVYVFPGQYEEGLVFEFTWKMDVFIGVSMDDGYYMRN